MKSRWLIVTNEEQALTTTSQLHDFSANVKQGLLRGRKYIQLIDQLVDTDDYETLLDAATQLTVMDVNSEYVQFPHQYQPRDYYLLFMGRLLEIHDNKSLVVQLNQRTGELSASLSPILGQAKFLFDLERSENGGSFFVETITKQKLCYINLERRMLRFNNRALINLFVIELAQNQDVAAETLEQAVYPLIAFTHYLKQDFGFSVDFGILDAANGTDYYLEQDGLQLTVIDRLFVKTAETDYMLVNLVNRVGAKLQLEHNISLELGVAPGSGDSQHWSFRVDDDREAVSLFDLLIRYPLIQTWYLNNREALEVKSDPLIFAN